MVLILCLSALGPGADRSGGDGQLGFLFRNASRPGAFQQRRLDVLQPQNDLASALVRQDLTELSSLNAVALLVIQMVSQGDPETGDHLRRVSQDGRLIGEGLAQDLQRSGTFVGHLTLFAALHDVGKVAVPDHNVEGWRSRRRRTPRH